MNAIVRTAKRRKALEKLRRRKAHREGIDKLISDAKRDLKETMLRADSSAHYRYKLLHQNEHIAQLQTARARKIE